MKAGQKINMKYLIIGAGGTGGVTGYYMKKAGKDVTLIARGEHLKKIQKSTGLFRKTSAVKHWRNFPMYPRSGQQDSITTQLPQISRKKAKPENFLRP